MNSECIQLESTEAYKQGRFLIEAAVTAELDACLINWARSNVGAPETEAGAILLLFREWRNDKNHPAPEVRLILGNDRVPVEVAINSALALLESAINAETEAFLADFLLHKVQITPDKIDRILQEFREIRGAIPFIVQEPEEPAE